MSNMCPKQSRVSCMGAQLAKPKPYAWSCLSLLWMTLQCIQPPPHTTSLLLIWQSAIQGWSCVRAARLACFWQRQLVDRFCPLQRVNRRKETCSPLPDHASHQPGICYEAHSWASMLWPASTGTTSKVSTWLPVLPGAPTRCPWNAINVL